jgi:magnesium-transporting ATPase (P-type)
LYIESIFFVYLLGGIALSSYVIGLYTGIGRGVGSQELFFRSMDIVTISVPITLPLIISYGIDASLLRLKLSGIQRYISLLTGMNRG